MSGRNKTCLFCLRQRQILVDNPLTAKALKKIYNIAIASGGCRLCIECHFYIGRISEFKHSIEAAADFDVDSCFVCKSESTINEPGVDRMVDYLVKQCTSIDLGNTDTVRACVTCLYLLEISIKYEKLARNFTNAQRFSKEFATMRECNIVLWKLNLDSLDNICKNYTVSGNVCIEKDKGNKAGKRSRGSCGTRDEPTSKRSKQEESVLPVMLTKLTPTVSRSGGKKTLSPTSTVSSKGKQNDKFFIKLPIPRKLLEKQNRKKYDSPHSPSRAIPASPSVDELNKIFGIKLRPLVIKIEHVDLSNYMNRTIAHDLNTRQLRKQKNEEFIGLDEEDVVELQQNNTSICSVGKRKSILVTERIESPNSAKKKVQFSDSPSIKYVDKLNFSDDESREKENSDDENDVDYDEKKNKKKTPKPQNGAPASPDDGKPRKGRPKKVNNDNKKDERNTETKDTNNGQSETPAAIKQPEEVKENLSASTELPETTVSVETQSDISSVVNGNTDEQHNDEESKPEPTTASENTDIESTDNALATPAMETEELEESKADDRMGIDESVDLPDAEMKDLSGAASPEDVEMSEKKSPPQEDVEMTEINNVDTTNHDDATLNSSPNKPTVNPVSPQEHTSSVDFASDKEDELEKVKLSFENMLGKELLDSESEIETADQGSKDDPTSYLAEKPVPDKSPDTDLDARKPSDSDTDNANVAVESKASEKQKEIFTELDDVDDISDDDDILNQLDDTDHRRSPELPPFGEDSL
ncbi:clumping factor A-like isoform X2 [Sabethes cyaneus]|uniref:clumping factor A-like isoform X2 n=1 Tax=Sabethes cyaneus TaxID=53552 RepID=UPI00237E4AAB|nr:clumping factor A-like isoform X2 [Sabethes cyaneus]